MNFMKDELDTDDSMEWIPVHGRRRSKSPTTPKKETNSDTVTGPNALGFNLPPEELPMNNRPIQVNDINNSNNQQDTTKFIPTTQKLQDWMNSSTVVNGMQEEFGEHTVKERDTEKEEDKVGIKHKNERINDNSKFSKPPHPNIPMNDGTHRLTIKWTTMEDIKAYERDKRKMNEDIHKLVTAMFPGESGTLYYRWESEDLVISKKAKNITDSELRNFITPKVTFIVAQRSQMIFGVRFGFSVNPYSWRRSEEMKNIFKREKLEVSISNSQSTSGNMVTAGYILLKAPNTTQVTWFSKYLCGLLPDSTPYFDLVRFRKTPMDQLIPHLQIRCGEKHVTPLCQALLSILTGRRSALFLPRYAFTTMSDDQVRNHFQFHEKWSKSLKAITLSPQINHLDQIRTEYNEDGSTTERSTRAWAASLQESDGTTPALCDVVNGTNDQKSYLVVPSHYFHQAQQQWRMYKSRLYPPSHRETRFRDTIPGLPDVIMIQKEIKSNVSFLEQMAIGESWRDKPESIRNEQVVCNKVHSSNQQRNKLPDTSQTTSRQASISSSWPTPEESSGHRTWKGSSAKHSRNEPTSVGSNTSLASEDDRSTEMTRTSTIASRNTMNKTFKEINSIIQNQQDVIEVSSRQTDDRLSILERQFNKIEDLDSKMTEVQKNLENTRKHIEYNQKKLSKNLQEMIEDTAKQIDEVQNNILDTKVNQQNMSTSLLDMRQQIDTLSKLMIAMGHKLDSAMMISCEQGSNSMVEQQRSAKRNQTETSFQQPQLHISRQDYPQESSIYKSPDKKKLRSRRSDNLLDNIQRKNNGFGDGDKTDQLELDSRVSEIMDQEIEQQREEDSPQDDNTSETSDVCLNLVNKFGRNLSGEKNTSFIQK